MSDQINTTATYTFQNNVELQLGQQKSLLWDTCEEQDCSDEKETVRDIFGNAMPQEADERHGDLKQTGVSNDRVWIAKPNELYFLEYVDGADQMATKISITGGYTMAAMGTINRSWDDQVLAGVYGPIISGKDGTITTPFPAGQIIPVGTGGASGAQRMNVAKMRAAKTMLQQGFVDLAEPRYMVLDAVQCNDLLDEVPVTSADFKGTFGAQVDENGNLVKFMGFNIIPMELRNPQLRAFSKFGFTVDSNGYTRNPFWSRSGIRKGVWRKLRTAIKDQPQKVDTRSVFAGTTVAATRTQAGKVGIILNSEA